MLFYIVILLIGAAVSEPEPKHSCVHNGMTYETGQLVDYGCYKCKCNYGIVECPDVNGEGVKEIVKGCNCMFLGEIKEHLDQWTGDCRKCLCYLGAIICHTDEDSCNDGCRYQGKLYNEGDTFDQDCNKCKCKGKEVICTEEKCSCEIEEDGEKMMYHHGDRIVTECSTCRCVYGEYTCDKQTCEEDCIVNTDVIESGGSKFYGNGCIEIKCIDGKVDVVFLEKEGCYH